MTPRQIELARHALGLTSQRRTSYRNHFVAGRDHADYADWSRMVASGHAVRHDGARLEFGGDDLFKLTFSGAQAALGPGERLDPEDFPNVTARQLKPTPSPSSDSDFDVGV